MAEANPIPTPAPPTPTVTDAPPSPMERRPSAERKPSAAEAQASAAGDSSPERKPSTAAAADSKPGDAEQPPAAGADGAPTQPAAAAPTSEAAGFPADASTASPPSPETPFPEKPAEPVNLQWDYSLPLPNCYFLPTLMDLCVPVLAKNFAKLPGFDGIPADERLRVVKEIPLDLPLKLAADMILEEAYWKRRVQINWRNCDTAAHGRSWKQMFFERNLQEALERCLPDLTK
ncbi:hypothetical protein Mapa_015138 [Marchantia paleacea]|nr:hypothetical protein Mapa_015138 [Marchantia paleacea]